MRLSAGMPRSSATQHRCHVGAPLDRGRPALAKKIVTQAQAEPNQASPRKIGNYRHDRSDRNHRPTKGVVIHPGHPQDKESFGGRGANSPHGDRQGGPDLFCDLRANWTVSGYFLRHNVRFGEFL